MEQEKINALADAIALRLTAKVQVTIDRMHITGRPKPAAYVDLTFGAGGQAFATVHGFKLMTKGDGQRWLAVPQTMKHGTGGEGQEPAKWEDRFKWGSKSVQAEAERVVKAAYDLEKPADQTAGGFASDSPPPVGGADDEIPW